MRFRFLPAPADDGDRTTAAIVSEAADVLAAFDEPLRLLDGSERARAAARHGEQWRAFVASRLLLRQELLARPELAAEEVRLEHRCRRCGGPHGRIVVRGHPEIHVSTSRAGAWVAVVVSESAVGIDLVHTVRPRASCDGRPGGEPETAAEVSCWTRKEALVKCGMIDLDDFDAVEVSGASFAWGRDIAELTTVHRHRVVVSVARVVPRSIAPGSATEPLRHAGEKPSAYPPVSVRFRVATREASRRGEPGGDDPVRPFLTAGTALSSP